MSSFAVSGTNEKHAVSRSKLLIRFKKTEPLEKLFYSMNAADYRSNLMSAFHHEMQLARSAKDSGNLNLAFHHYERAHILSQKYTVPHIKSHLGMLHVGYLRKDAREIFGQCVRVVAALIFSKLWVPIGNTGGAKVSALKPMPIPDDLKRLLNPV